MKGMTAMGAMLMLVAMALLPTLVIEGEANALDGVDVRWERRQLVVTNNNDYPIYNLSLEGIALTGFVVIGQESYPNVTISDLLPGASCSFFPLGWLILGFGIATLIATVSYLDQGEKVTQEASITFFLLGPIALFIG